MQHGVGDDGCLGGQGFERGKPAVFGVVKRAQIDAVEEFFYRLAAGGWAVTRLLDDERASGVGGEHTSCRSGDIGVPLLLRQPVAAANKIGWLQQHDIFLHNYESLS